MDDPFAAQPLATQDPLGAGDMLVFSHMTLSSLSDLYTLDDANGIRRIAHSDQYDTTPVWSPDGARLLYTEQYAQDWTFPPDRRRRLRPADVRPRSGRRMDGLSPT